MRWVVFCMFFYSGLLLGQIAPEQICDDGLDNDRDGLSDCADADCRLTPTCKGKKGSESTNKACSDWVDNDRDGQLDCDDMECHAPNIDVCKGSWDKQKPVEVVGQTLLKQKSAGGENNEMTCSDGLDNDNDGQIDCEDSDCLANLTLSACRSSMNVRFLIAAKLAPFIFSAKAEKNKEGTFETETEFDAEISALQFRALGQIPFIDRSFFLVSARLERVPRITFALFQVPLWKSGYFNVNTGGGTLSNALILSATKQALDTPAYALYTPFERRMKLAAEMGSFLDEMKRFHVRAFAAGGTGRAAGNIGNFYYPKDISRYVFALGGMLQWNVIGHYNRWDSHYLYRKAPKTLALMFGGKFAQREYEKFLVFSPQLMFKWGRVSLFGESYIKKEFDFDSWQIMWHVQAAFLLVPKHLMLAADVGEVWLGAPKKALSTEVSQFQSGERLRNTLIWRFGLHWFFWKDIGIASVYYSEERDRPSKYLAGQKEVQESEVKLQIQFRI